MITSRLYTRLNLSDEASLQAFLDQLCFVFSSECWFIETGDNTKEQVTCELVMDELSQRHHTVIYSGTSSQDATEVVWINVKQFNDAFFEYPHSEIGWKRSSVYKLPDVISKLSALAKASVSEIAFCGKSPGVRNMYNLDPNSVGIGVLELDWITVFGKEYQNIVNQIEDGAFHIHETDCDGYEVVVLTESPDHIGTDLSKYRKAIGEDLFLTNVEFSVGGVEQMSLFSLKFVKTMLGGWFKPASPAKYTKAKSVPSIYS